MAKAGDEIGRIAEIWRYPVQSMRGEALEAADIAAAGVVGDRRYGVVDPEAGMVVSSALADKSVEEKRSEYSHSPLHLLTTASLRQFAEHHPDGRFAPARFRPNIVIDTSGATGFLEQGWIERRFAIGDGVEIAVSEHCKRCVMTTLPQGDLPFDPAILHTTTAHNETRAGVYATVVRPGRIKVGDPVRALG